MGTKDRVCATTTGPVAMTSKMAAHLRAATRDDEITEKTTEGNSNDEVDKSALGYVKWAGWKVFYGMEWVGEHVAVFLGLTDSKYQYYIDIYERDLRRARMEIERERAKAARDQEVMNAIASERDESMEGGPAADIVEKDAEPEAAANDAVATSS